MASLTFIYGCLLLSVSTFCLSSSSSREFEVGGKEGGWKIPPSSDESLNEWAEENRFKIGDTLVFKYDKKKDSVLEVTKEDYQGCNTSKPITEDYNGETRIKLGKTGPCYFISGAKGHCEMGQKLVVVVLSTHGQEGESSLAPIMSPAFNHDPEASPPEGVLAPQKGASYRLRIEYFNLLCFGLACLIGI